jgi:prephenate dehydratase
MSKVAIQGYSGSFHDQAARQFFGTEYSALPQKTFRDVFNSVNNEDAQFGIVAIENSLHGSINPVYRLFAEHSLFVVGEVRLKIDLYLIGSNKDVTLPHITTVVSQAEALSQCESWLDTNIPNVQREEFYDTAAAVEHIKSMKNTAAIASKIAAVKYNGSLLTGPINDDLENYTRFFVICKTPDYDKYSNRSSIIMSELDEDKAGNLHDALGIFAKHSINLSKIDSHTLPGVNRRYAFYIDFDEHALSETGKNVLEDLKILGWSVSLLGTYKKYEH